MNITATPTHEECKALAERWPESFQYYDFDGHTLNFQLGEQLGYPSYESYPYFPIGMSYNPGKKLFYNEENRVMNPAEALAVLTALCKEIARKEGYWIAEMFNERWCINDFAPELSSRAGGDFHEQCDTPWQALLRVSDSVTDPRG